MKHRIAYSLLAAVTAAFTLLTTGCADSDDASATSVRVSKVVSLTASVGTTQKRSVTRGTLQNTFDGTELVAVSMRVEDAAVWPTVRRYVAATSGRLTHSGNTEKNAEDTDPWVWPEDADSISLMGWYTADYYRTEIDQQEFGVPEDQTTMAKMQAHDFLYAPEATFRDPDAQSVTMTMWHQLSLVVVNIDSDEPLTANELASVRMFSPDWAQTSIYTQPLGDNTKLFGAWGTYGGAFAGKTAFTDSVRPLLVSHSDDSKKVRFTALVLPQQTRGRHLIGINHGDRHYSYTLPADEAESPDYLPGLVYNYDLLLRDKLVLVTPEPWEKEPDKGTPIACTVAPWDPVPVIGGTYVDADPWDISPQMPGAFVDGNPWQYYDLSGTYVDANPWLAIDMKSATYVNLIPWLRTDQHENKVTADPWLPKDLDQTNVQFWIIDWMKEDQSAEVEYLLLRKESEHDSIPVNLTDTLKWDGDWFIYSGGTSTHDFSSVGNGFSSPTYSAHTEGYTNWYVQSWELNRSDLSASNTEENNPWAFRVDDNSRMANETVNVLRLKAAFSGGSKTIRIFKRTRNTAFDLSTAPDATATIYSDSDGEVVTAKIVPALHLEAGEYLIFDAPASTFYFNDNYMEKFFCKANTSKWATYGSALGIDVGYYHGSSFVDTEGKWYITSYTDNSASLTESREAAATATSKMYSYPPTMQVRLRGKQFNAFRFLRYQYGSFTVYAVRRGTSNSNTRRTLGTVTVSADDETADEQLNDRLLVTRFLKDSGGNIVTATLNENEYLLINGGLSNWYSSAGGYFSEYDNSPNYLYGPEGYYTLSGYGTWTWEGSQYGLLGVDVGLVTPPEPEP